MSHSAFSIPQPKVLREIHLSFSPDYKAAQETVCVKQRAVAPARFVSTKFLVVRRRRLSCLSFLCLPLLEFPFQNPRSKLFAFCSSVSSLMATMGNNNLNAKLVSQNPSDSFSDLNFVPFASRFSSWISLPSVSLDNLEIKLQVLLGDMGAGKSSLVLRFVKGQFLEFQESTIGAAFFSQTLAVNDATVKFEIWDTAGQERYHSLAPMYYRGAAAAIIVYDITSTESFARAKKWVQELQKQGNPNMVMALAGNKADLEDKRKVAAEEARTYAEENSLFFMETSAKTAMFVSGKDAWCGSHLD
ncbi:hypothetical protein ACLOJK_017261 [Asimina triloba]